MQTQAWDLSIHSVRCHEFDIFHRPCDWVTSRQHVWMLATSGRGLYHRRGVPDGEPLPVDPAGEALHYLPPDSWRFVDVCNAEPLHLVVLRLCLVDDSGHDLFANYRLPRRFSPSQKEELADPMHCMLAAFDQKTLSAQAEMQRQLGRFLGMVLGMASTRPDEELRQRPERCQKAIAYLFRHYAEELDIDRLAQLCCVSRPHFFRLFRAETGLTAQQYLCRLRLDHARTMLRFTEMSIAEVGRAVGWHDQFHFSRVFSRENGCCPSTFRRREPT
jgi:AraC-like DNA-binding protein